MLSSMRAVLLSIALILSVGCGNRGTTTVETTAEEVVNVDSLLDVMAVRYDRLCAERKMAYSERNPERRRELLECNDAACKALDDSLRWVREYRERGRE